ncbi:MAG: O-antigen ligase family protein [Thermoanaerobaculia bacterium]
MTAEPIPRRPGTPARILLFATALGAYALALSVLFPPGAPDRLPVLVFSILLALATAQRWGRGVRIFAFLLPCAGLLARLSGGTDPAAWPVLLFSGVAAGWTFRFIYDFDTLADPSGPDRTVRALAALWVIAALLAVVEARTLWALLHGLSGRTVNGEGLPESTAIRESLLSFGALASGAGFFLLLRRSGDAIRRQALSAALLGTGLCAAAAILQRLSVLPGEPHRFWRLTGRLSGGAVDPNSLGLLCALALALGIAVWSGRGGRRLPALLATLLLGTGLLLSGSRSGLLVAAGSLLLLLVFRRRARSLRTLALAAGAVALLFAVALLLSGSRGTLGERLSATFDASRPASSRISARPMLWAAAWRLFREHPLEGGGMGVYTWRLPDLLPGGSLPWKMRDNPGSAYVQALAETGILGLALTLLFAAALGRDAMRRLARGEEETDPAALAASAAVISFLAALAVGSHWLATDAGLFFFLVASLAVLPAEPRAWPPRVWLATGLLLYAAAALVSALSTARAQEAFRHGSRIGLHPPERVPGGQFQWTRQNFALWLAAGERRRLGLAHFSPVGLPVEIAAREGGRLLYRRTLRPGEAVTLRLSGGARSPAAIRFALSRSFVPRRLGIPGGDARQLGLQAVFPDR